MEGIKKTIFLILLFVLIAGSIIAVWYFYEKPRQDNAVIKYNEMTIATFVGGNKVESGYAVVFEDIKPFQVYREGKSDAEGFVKEVVLQNRTYMIYNKNLENQNYYSDRKKDFSSPDRAVQRYELKLVKPATNLSFNQNGKFGIDNQINVSFSPNAPLRKIVLCLEWSSAVIRTEIEYYEKIELPERLKKKVDKCYKTELNLNANQTMNFSIIYSIFGDVVSKDFINVYIVDGDYHFDSNGLIITDYNGGDIFAKDFRYTLL